MRAIWLATLVPLAACGNGGGRESRAGVAPSGTGTTRSYPVADFTGVELRGPDDVDVRVGAAFSVRAEGDAKMLDRLKIERVGDTLRVGREGKGWSWSSGDGVRVFVTMPRIAVASLAGSGDLSVDRAEGAQFDANLAGSGTLRVGALAVEDARLSIAGSGNVAAGGTARALKASIAGAGNIEAGGLTASSADVSIAGSGNITAKVDGEAKVSLMGSGNVDLGANARCRTRKGGSGEVRCGG